MKKNKLILLQLFIAFVLICTSVYAAVNTTIGLKVSNNVVKRGDTVSVTLSLENVINGEKIDSVSGYINYDKKVIDPIDVNSIQQENNTVTIGNQTLPVEDLTDADVNEVPTSSAYVAFNGNPDSDNDTRILIDFEQGITEDTDLITVDFKVKSNATIGEIRNAITYSLFVVTANSEESDEITKNVNLTVQAVTDDNGNDEEPGTENENKDTDGNTNTNTNSDKKKDENTNKNVNTNTNTNKNTNTNSNTNKNTNTNSNSNKDNTLVGAVLPATGARMIVVPAIILIVLAYVCYNKYMKYKDI